MKQLTLALNHAEAVWLAHTLAAAKEHHAELGMRETDSAEQTRQIVAFRHAEQLAERLDAVARPVVFGW